MKQTTEVLQNETKKWLGKIRGKKIIPKENSKEVREQITNIKAYISDCKYFLDNGDLVRAFEAVIYAWAILETLERLHMIEDESKDS